MTDTACDAIKEKIENLLHERQTIAWQMAALNARIEGLREALDAFEASSAPTTAPKAKRAYKRRAAVTPFANGPHIDMTERAAAERVAAERHATELKSSE